MVKTVRHSKKGLDKNDVLSSFIHQNAEAENKNCLETDLTFLFIVHISQSEDGSPADPPLHLDLFITPAGLRLHPETGMLLLFGFIFAHLIMTQCL